MTSRITHDDEPAIRDLLIGRRIVAAETGEFPYREGEEEWQDEIYTATGKLTLDDGSTVLVAPNQGDCGCSAGDYDLTSLAVVNNVITSVRAVKENLPRPREEWEDEDDDDQGRSGPTRYCVFVFADAAEVNAIQIDGDDGNGYYGTGYELIVTRPQETK